MNRVIFQYLLCCIIFLNACKKKEDVKPVSTPKDFWFGELVAEGTTFSDFCLAGTPDNLLHVGQPGSLSVVGTKESYSRYYMDPRKYYELIDDYKTVALIAGGKDGEVYFRIGIKGDVSDDIDAYYNNDLYCMDSSYHSLRNIGQAIKNKITQLLGYSSYYNCNSITTDPNGGLYVGVGYAENSTTLPGLRSVIAYSTDKGASFTFYQDDVFHDGHADQGFFDDGIIRKISIDEYGYMYAYTSNNTVMVSRGLGQKWSTIPFNNLSDYKTVKDIAIGSKGDLYIATDKALLLATNYGANVTSINVPSQMLTPVFEHIIANKKGTLYAQADTLNMNRPDSSFSNCFYSKDKGYSWKSLPNPYQGREVRLKGFDHTGRIMATNFNTYISPFLPTIKYTGVILSSLPAE